VAIAKAVSGLGAHDGTEDKEIGEETRVEGVGGGNGEEKRRQRERERERGRKNKIGGEIGEADGELGEVSLARSLARAATRYLNTTIPRE